MGPKLTKEEKKLKALDVSAEREELFHLVAKIISWKTKSPDSQAVQNQDKISLKEWRLYEKHLLEISKTESVQEVKKKLSDAFKAIEANQGFENTH